MLQLAALLLVAQVQVPPPRGYVNDFAGVLDAQSISHMDAVIAEVREKTRGEIAVVTLPDIGDRPAADVALEIGRRWGVGAKGAAGDPATNLGVVVLLVPQKNHRPGTGQIFIATLNRSYVIRLDSIWSPVAKYLAALPDKYNRDEAYRRYQKAREASVDMLIRLAPDIRQLLTPEQRRKLPALVASYLDTRYLASIRSGTAGAGSGPMMFPGNGIFTAPAGGGATAGTTTSDTVTLTATAPGLDGTVVGFGEGVGRIQPPRC